MSEESRNVNTTTPTRGVPSEIVSSTTKYSVGRQIGQGASGGVYLCKRESDGKFCALKAVRVDHLRMNSADFAAERKSLFREIEILKSLKHPGIVELFDVVENGNYIFLIMEYVPGGELFTRITDDPAFKDEGVVKYVMVQLIDTFLYMHAQNVIHRDCKAENVLVLSSEPTPPNPEHTVLPAYPVVKCVDFGLSKQITNSQSLATTWVGTPQYWAPEVLLSRDTGKPYDGRVDIWSLGVLLYVMLCRRYPFPEVSKTSPLPMTERILRGVFDFNGVARPVSDDAKDLICRLIVPDPTRRLSLEEALKHPWLADSIEAQRARERWVSGGSSVEVISEPSHGSDDHGQPGLRVVPADASPSNAGLVSESVESVHNSRAIVQRVSPRHHTVTTMPVLQNLAVQPAGELKAEGTIPLMELAQCQTEITRTLNRVAQSLRTRPGSARIVADLLRRARELHFGSAKTISGFAVTAESVEHVLDDTQAFVAAKLPEAAIACLEEVRQYVVEMHKQSQQVQNEYRRLASDVSRLLQMHSAASVAVSASAAAATASLASSTRQESVVSDSQGPAPTGGDSSASNALVLLGRPHEKLQRLSENQQLELLEVLGILNLASSFGEASGPLTGGQTPEEVMSQATLVLAAGGDNAADLQREFAWLTAAARELRKVDAILERCRLFWSNVEHCVLRLNQFKDAATRLLENARNSESLYARYLERMVLHRQFWQGFRTTCSIYAERSQIEYQLSIDEAHRLADVVDHHLNL